MAVAAMQGTNQHIRSSLGFSILPKDTSTCRQGESNQRPLYNKMLALPLIHSHTNTYIHIYIVAFTSAEIRIPLLVLQTGTFVDVDTEKQN